MSAKLLLIPRSVLPPLLVVLLTALTPPAQAATAGELLEKAIYTEETVGDVDQAIRLYEQVIAEGETATAAAAKAQYRLGLIYQKQGHADQAAAAFRAVVENYPKAKDLVAQARKQLPSDLELLPMPWQDGDEMTFHMKLATGVDIGTMIYRIESIEHEGRDAWRCWTRGLVTLNGADSVSWVICDKETFAPIESYWKHSMLGEARAEYGPDAVTINVTGKEDPVRIKLTEQVFDNEQGMELFRLLLLKDGYKTELSIVSILGAAEIDLGLEVTGTEKIETPAGSFDCHKMELNIGQTFWIADDEPRYVVRFVAGGATAELVSVQQRKREEQVAAQGEGFKLQLPPMWRTYALESELNSQEGDTVYLLDPQAIVSSTVKSGPLNSLSEEERKSPGAWTESAMEKIGTSVQNFKIRDPGVRETEIDSQNAATVIADFGDGKEQKTLYGVAVFTDGQAINLRFTAPADKFDELKPQFDAIVENLEIE